MNDGIGVARAGLMLAAMGLANVGAASTVGAATAHPLAETCDLFRITGVEDTSVDACTKCHGHGRASLGSNHPVDVDYASAVARSAGSAMGLRPLSVVVSRGVFLPDGQIRCVTCHDGRSPWKYGIALPPGARVTPAVNPRDPSTYEDGPALRAREAGLATSTERYWIAVGTKPLCLVCHAAD